MEEPIMIHADDIEIIDKAEYGYDVAAHFSAIPDVAVPLMKEAKRTLGKIEQMLYTAPGFINMVKASVPEEVWRVIFTDEQKAQIASGALKLMTTKDGSILAKLIDPKTHKIVADVPIKSVKMAPEISQAMTSYATQMQMAQIAEMIQAVQVAVEEIRQGQESDRLATAYSCQQKLLQAISIKNPRLKEMALLGIASDAEDSRNLLMQSQSANVTFIREQPEAFIRKLFSGASPEKIDSRMKEIRENLCAVNMVSFVEAMAYQELGEFAAARQSLQYYADYIQRTYLNPEGFVERLDLIDPSPENYWSKMLPGIQKGIQALPCAEDHVELMEEVCNER